MFGIERTWWRLFQKRVMRITFDIYVFFMHDTLLQEYYINPWLRVQIIYSISYGMTYGIIWRSRWK